MVIWMINKNEWKKFKLGDIFKIEKSQNINSEIAEESLGDEIPYITRTEYNNGVNFFVNRDDFVVNKGNCITIGGEGANIFYQPIDFISGNNITKIYHDKLTENSALFIVTILSLEKYRYSYNRAFNKTFITNTIVKLPSDTNGNPDWKYMENYISLLRERERESLELSEKILNSPTDDLYFVNWKKINLQSIFDITLSNNKVIFSNSKKISNNLYCDNNNIFLINSLNSNSFFIFKSNNNFSLRVNEFFCALLDNNKHLWKNIFNIELNVPIDSNNNINYSYIEEYMKLRDKYILPLWSDFKLNEIFKIANIKKFSSLPEEKGKIPYISSSSENQGVIDFIETENVFNKQCLTISTNGKCFDVFVHNEKISVSSDVEILFNDKLSIYSLFFISTILKLEQNKWGYGRKPKNNKILDIKIILPIDKNGNPNWYYMEKYIKKLPYSKFLR